MTNQSEWHPTAKEYTNETLWHQSPCLKENCMYKKEKTHNTYTVGHIHCIEIPAF